MTYKQATEFLFIQFPQFQKVGVAGYKPGLDGMKSLANWLGNPQQQFLSVHIAGTNGKGSVAHMIAAVLQQSGYRTGLYTSPHLIDFRERIKINGQMIPENEVVAFVEAYCKEFVKQGRNTAPKPSFFEITTALAFQYFAQQKVDIAVIETGLGGRLDSTNILDPARTVLSIITNIGLEHCDMLGDTLEKIAYEKAGIIKPCVPVVIGEARTATMPVFEARAKELNAPLVLANPLTEGDATVSAEGNAEGMMEGVKGSQTTGLSGFPQMPLMPQMPRLPQIPNLPGLPDLPEVPKAPTLPGVPVVPSLPDLRAGTSGVGHCEQGAPDLPGCYQQLNRRTVSVAVDILRQQGWAIPSQTQAYAMAHAATITGLHGRWETVARNPKIVIDTAHNAHGLRFLNTQLMAEKYDRLFFVFGVVKEKDLTAVLPLLPPKAYYIFTQAQIYRALPALSLAQSCRAYGLNGEVCSTVPMAVKRARELAGPSDMILIGGSNFTVGEALPEF